VDWIIDKINIARDNEDYDELSRIALILAKELDPSKIESTTKKIKKTLTYL